MVCFFFGFVLGALPAVLWGLCVALHFEFTCGRTREPIWDVEDQPLVGQYRARPYPRTVSLAPWYFELPGARVYKRDWKIPNFIEIMQFKEMKRLWKVNFTALS